MKAKIEEMESNNASLANAVKKLRKREIEIIRRWDLDDIDLVTERLEFLKSETSKSALRGISYFYNYRISGEKEAEEAQEQGAEARFYSGVRDSARAEHGVRGGGRRG